MKRVTTTPELSPSTTEINSHLFDDWFDPIESGIRERVRGLIEEMIRGELDAALSRPRYGRRAGHAEDSGVAAAVSGHRHGSRVRTLTGTFGKTEIAVPRARLNTSDGKTLQKAIEGLHRCSARLVRSVPVKETHEGAAVWDGIVHVFDLAGHPAATRIYAWSSPIAGTPDQRRFFAVLHQGQVTSPTDAVRAAIARQEDMIPN